MDEEVRFFL